MTDQTFAIIWILSFGLYFLIYTFWIPVKTQQRIENWLRDSESDETLLLALEVIVKRIREQTLIDFGRAAEHDKNKIGKVKKLKHDLFVFFPFTGPMVKILLEMER